MFSLKSAQQQRVDISQAQRLGSERQNLGHGEMCPASAGHLNFDIYGRKVTQNTIRMLDSNCSHYASENAARRIQTESVVERPYIGWVPAAGHRGANDTMGITSRHLQPRNLYDSNDYRGGFVRHYMTPNNAPPSQGLPPLGANYYRQVHPFTFSHDANHALVK